MTGRAEYHITMAVTAMITATPTARGIQIKERFMTGTS
jgi:hypothetical protein